MLTTVRRVSLLAAICVVTAIATSFAQADTVYVTKTGEKYHRASCRSLSRSKIEMPLAQAAARYGACKVCKPPVPATVPAATGAASIRSPEVAPAARSSRCQATTKKRAQCSRNAQPGRTYCWQH
jgi:hypothetical protein